MEFSNVRSTFRSVEQQAMPSGIISQVHSQDRPDTQLSPSTSQVRNSNTLDIFNEDNNSYTHTFPEITLCAGENVGMDSSAAYASQSHPETSELEFRQRQLDNFKSRSTTDTLFPEFYEDFLSPVATSILDEYANNPDFLASQEELRGLLFATAQSTVPTRNASPDNLGVSIEGVEHAGKSNFMIKILNTTKRVDFLRNYINEVAPWVSSYARIPRVGS